MTFMACRHAERPWASIPGKARWFRLQTTAATHLLLEPLHIDANRVPLDQMTNYIQVIVRGRFPSSIMHAPGPFGSSSLGCEEVRVLNALL